MDGRRTRWFGESTYSGRETNKTRKQLGAKTVTLSGQKVSEELLNYARSRNVSKIIIGQPLCPRSREILKIASSGADLDKLKYYRLVRAGIGGCPVEISRTGYTGDLGYEIWLDAKYAELIWDTLIAKGTDYGLTPAGIWALYVARIEAGLIMLDVDYVSARKANIEAQKSSPSEIGLGWAVSLDKSNFIGRKALLKEKEQV